ncbi:MAG TPA: beta-ketoacyl synthase N-terminal-like domain-containing protein [Candidatus Angelobacter sp.]
MAEFPPADSVEKIAVVGMACRYAEAWNIEQFWQNLKEGRECVRFLTDHELLEAGVSSEVFSRPDYVKAAAVCPGTFLFDASFFGYTPREAELLDPQHRVLLECAWEALEHAGYDAVAYPGRIGLFAGSGSTQYLFELLCNPGIHDLVDAFTLFICGEKDFLATRIGYKMNLRGPCVTVQTACSTSLVGIVMACQSLLNYQSDIALAGGVTLSTSQVGGYLYQEGGIRSPDGHTRTFDADARGSCAGTGAGVVVLKRLEDALAEGDTIHAVLLGEGIANDGAARVGFAAPGVNGQFAAISDAIAMAGIDPETIGFVECQGTATSVGDPIEITALNRAFRAYTQMKNFCAVGSVKTNIGNTDTAGGVAGFIKAVLSLKNRQIPASLHFRKPNPHIDFANSPFYVNTQLKPWTREGPPRRAGVSAFGLGGTNAHVILEEAPDQAPSPAAPWNLLVWSARSATALEKMTINLLDHLKAHPQDSLADVAYTLQVGRQMFSRRRMLVCRSHHEAVAALTSAAPGRLLMGHREKEPGPVTFLFPGLGSQYVNMGREVYSHQPIFREHVDLCAKFLKPELGLDLREILYPAPGKTEHAAASLDQVRYASPILFTVEYAMAKLWMHWGVRPAAVTGHGIGEYAAACIAGVFSLEDALAVVSARGRLMQQMPAGCMTGVMLRETQLNSTIMDPVLQEFHNAVQKIKLHPPDVPYISNLSGTWATVELTDPEYWVKHVRQTVLFADGVTELLNHSQRILLEVGPGRSLSSTIAQHPARVPEHVILPSLPHPKNDSQGDFELVLTTLAQLWLEGLRIDWKAFHSPERRRRIPLPAYPFERQHYQLTGALRARIVAEQDDLHISNPVPQPDGRNGPHPPDWIRAIHPRPNLPVPYVAPRNELEQAIADAWQDILGIVAPGINDSFVALGGHSLLALQLVGRIRALFEIEITVANLFQAPTITGLADLIVRQLSENLDSATLAEMIRDVDAVPQTPQLS